MTNLNSRFAFLSLLFLLIGGQQLSVAQTFTENQQFFGFYETWDVEIADLDGDTWPDMFVVNRGFSASPTGEDNGVPNEIWTNNGDGTFTRTQSNMAARNSMGVALGDLDGDGDLDAFVVNAYENNNQVSQPNWDENVVWINQGGIQAGTPGIFAEGWSDGLTGVSADASFDVKLHDFDADGDLDAVIASVGGSSKTRIWENDGSASFTSFTLPGANVFTSSVAVLDINNDAKKDIVVGSGARWVNTSIGGVMSFSRIADIPNVAAINGASATIAVDFDNDGDDDVVMGDNWGSNDVWRNDGGTLTYVGTWGSSGPLFSAATLDANGDDFPDMIESTNVIYLGDGSGGFVAGESFSVSSGRSFGVGDIDKDGDEDFVYGQAGQISRTFLSNIADPGVITVNSAADDLSAGDGSCTLREAMTNGLGDTEGTSGDCNTGAVGTDNIRFNIASATSEITITPTSPLPTLTSSLFIDGSTQPGASCASTIPGRTLRIVLDGSSAGPVDGIHITGNGSTVRGLVINGWAQNGVKIQGGDNNIIDCNFIGTNVDGTVADGNSIYGVGLSGSALSNTIGTVGRGNLISDNSQGIQLEPGATGTNIYANFLGTDRTGTVDMGNDFAGIGNNQAGSLTIGGSGAGQGNLISGSPRGISTYGATGTTINIKGNLIGTDLTGTLPVPNDNHGIYIHPISGPTPTLYQIGGASNGEGNIIAFNGAGVGVANDADITGTTIIGNSFFSNTGLGIDLGADGVTANDVDDADVGPNNFQNWLTGDARIDGSGDMVMAFTPTSSPANSTYPITISLYEADGDEEEGARFIKNLTYNTYPNTTVFLPGNAAANGITVGDKIVINATDANGNSSEFGPPITVLPVPPAEYDALVALYNSTNGGSWTDNTNWLVGHEVDTWFGVNVVNGHVSEVNLNSNNLVGTIPSSISALSELVGLRLYDNSLTGSIPTSIGTMSNLSVLYLSSNGLTGGIPSQLSNLTLLQFLELGDNPLGGSIPASLSSLVNLRSITLNSAGLSGNIPDIFGGMTQLTSLWLNVNNFDGPLPASLGSATALRTFFVSENQLTGDVTPAFATFTDLDRFSVYNNFFTSLPDLTNSGTFSELYVWSNYFDFDDLEPNAAEIDNPTITQRAFGTASSPSVTSGDPINLSFPSLGGTPANISYQWKLDGNPIPGATNEIFSDPSADPSDAGQYTLEATNSVLGGLVLTSEPNTLSVLIPSVPQSEIDALIAIYNATSGTSWNDNTNWDTVADISTWYGVQTSGGHITHLNLDSNNLVGPFPGAELLNLPGLQVLNLRWNDQLTGSIPTEIGNLPDLREFRISQNGFTGSIPIEIGSATNLEVIEMAWMPNITGTLPSQIQNLVNLRELFIAGTNLTGTLPTWIDSLTQLTDLYLMESGLSGSMPTELGNLSNLRVLKVYGNDITGSVPASLSNLASTLIALDIGGTNMDASFPTAIVLSLSNLEVLVARNIHAGGPLPDLSSMTSLTHLELREMPVNGPLPAWIGSMTQLFYLDLFQNGFTGNIPAGYAALTSLTGLNLYNNSLDGAIPSWIGNFTNLSNLGLANNNFSGSIPTEIGTLADLWSLDVGVNSLSGAVPASLASAPNLRYLHLHNNDLTGLPDFGASPFLVYINVNDNRLEFDDLLPTVTGSYGGTLEASNMKLFGNYQAINVDEGLPLAFSQPSPGAGNAYQWFKGAILLSGETSDAMLIDPSAQADAGQYILRVTNPSISALTLESEPVDVTVQRQVSQAEIDALTALYNATDGANWTTKTNWTIDPDVSTWHGVTVVNGYVTEVNLPLNNLVGTIPSEIGDLTGLLSLQLQGNSLTGSIPASLFGITGIQLIDLSANSLSGTVVTTFSTLDSLSQLLLNDNNLTGVPNFSSLAALSDFQIQDNRLLLSHLVPNAGITGFQYAPQANFGVPTLQVVGAGAALEISFPAVGGEGSLFQWKKDGNPIAGATSEAYLKASAEPSDTGSYVLEATNPGLPGFTLVSEAIDLSVSALVVNTASDDTTPGNGECSLREAIQTANADADVSGGDCIPKGGFDTITFDIPGAGPHVIQPSSPLPDISNALLIDGYSQSGAAPNTLGYGQGSNAIILIELDGANTPPGTNGLDIQTAGVVVRGIAVNSFPGSGIWIQEGASAFEEFQAALTVSDEARSIESDLILGLSPTAGNGVDTGEDVEAAPSPPSGAFDARFTDGGADLTSDFRSSSQENHVWTFRYDVVSGNALIRWNTEQFPAYGALNLLDTSGGSVVNVNMREATSALVPDGISELEIRYSLPVPGTDNRIEGVFVGLDASGTIAKGNQQDGIVVDGGSYNVIGGSDLDALTVIAANSGWAVVLNSDASHNVVQNTYMGVNAPYSAALPNGQGVFIAGANNTIGGSASGEGNIIAFNGGVGVRVSEPGTTATPAGNRILGNRISANSGLGIDLYSSGGAAGLVDTNDLSDLDTGANQGMNYPVLTSARYSGNTATLSGTINTIPSARVRVEFFTSPGCDPSGFGEGRYFLGHQDVFTNGSGDASFEAFLSVSGIPGRFASATATDESGNTSEFSSCIAPEVVIPNGYIMTEVETGLDTPQGIDFGGDGTVYVSSTGSGEVYRYDSDGNPLDAGAFLFGIDRPIDLAVTDNPKLFVTSLDQNAIYRFDLTTTSPGTDASLATPWLSGLNAATHMTLGDDGMLYYSEVRGLIGEKISRVDPESPSPVPEVLVTFPDTENINPQGIAFADGYMYFTTQGPGQIVRVDLDAAPSLPVTYGDTQVMFGGLDNPGGIDIGTDGDLFVATLSDVFSASVTSAVMVPFISGLAGSSFNNLAIDDSGHLYYADQARGDVVEVIAPLAQVQSGGTMTYLIHEDGAPTISDGSDFDAVRAAFQNWNDVSTADVSFVDGGTTSNQYADPNDGQNIVTFSDDAFPFPPFVLAIAAKRIEYSGSGGDLAEIVDADIVVNPEFLNKPGFNYGTDSYPGYFDIESILTHESGHVLGMIHSGIPQATMFFALPEAQDGRSLEPDDMAWVSKRYPDPGAYPSLGSISGTVFDGESTSVGAVIAGALVIATDIASSKMIHTYSELDGSYEIPGLPLSDYKVSIQPLDGDVFGFPLVPEGISPNLASISTNRGFLEEFYNDANESDDPTVDDVEAFDVVTVTGAVSGIDFTSNKDITPPVVSSAFPVDGATGIETESDLAIRFSESVIRSTVSVVLNEMSGGSIVQVIELTKTFTEDDTLLLLSMDETMKPSTEYRMDLSGAVSDLRGNLLNPAPGALESFAFNTEFADLVAPTVVSVSPEDAATEIQTRSEISVIFSESMDPKSLTDAGAVILSVGGNPVPISVEVDRDLDYSVARVVPDNPLAEQSVYVLDVAASVRDASGVAMGAAYQTGFETVIINPPHLTDFGPYNGAAGVTVETPVVLDFSEAIDPASASISTVRLTGPSSGLVQGAFEFLYDDTRLVFRPDFALEEGTLYQLNVSGIKDLSGNLLDNPLESNFTTAVTVRDPVVESVSPLAGVVGTTVVITGTGFDANASFVNVSFNGVSAVIEKADLTSITTSVPEGATSGLVQISVGPRVSNSLVFDIVELNTSTDEATSTISRERSARDTEITPDGSHAYVTHPLEGEVSILDLSTTTFDPIPIPVGDFPFKISINPSGTRAYVTNFDSHTVSVINIDPEDPDYAYNEEITQVPVGLNPTGIAATPDGSRIYVAEFTSKGISIIDGDPGSGGVNKVVARISRETSEASSELDPDGARISRESAYRDVEITPDGTRALATGSAGLLIFDINPESSSYNQAIARVSRETSDAGSELDPDGTRTSREIGYRDVEILPDGTSAFVSSLEGEILWIDINPDSPEPYQVIARTSREASARELELSPDGSLLYVTAVRLDPVTLQEINVVDVYELGISATGAPSTVLSLSRDPIVTTGFSFTLIDTFELPEEPESVVLDERRNSLLVTSPDPDAAVTIITFGEDADNDGLSDEEEAQIGTLPDNPDTDADGAIDGLDVFPLDPAEQLDVDLDGVGDNRDLDDDESTLPDRREVILERIRQLSGVCMVIEDAGDKSSKKSGKSSKKSSKKSGKSSKASGRDLQKAVEKSIELLEKTLEDKYWLDIGGMSLHPKDGSKVFDRDIELIDELITIAESGSNCSAVADELVLEVVSMDRELTEIAMDEVLCAGGDKCEKEMGKAVDDYDKAIEDLEDEDWAKALNNFKKAWKHTAKAVSHAANGNKAGNISDQDENAIDQSEDLLIPDTFLLEDNYPNPFNPETSIRFGLPESAAVRIEVFDVIGRRVAVLVNDELAAGYHQVRFDASKLASGLYVYRMTAGGLNLVKKMVLMK